MEIVADIFPLAQTIQLKLSKLTDLEKVSINAKRIFSCHPLKLLGGGEGFDPVVKKIKEKNNGY